MPFPNCTGRRRIKQQPCSLFAAGSRSRQVTRPANADERIASAPRERGHLIRIYADGETAAETFLLSLHESREDAGEQEEEEESEEGYASSEDDGLTAEERRQRDKDSKKARRLPRASQPHHVHPPPSPLPSPSCLICLLSRSSLLSLPLLSCQRFHSPCVLPVSHPNTSPLLSPAPLRCPSFPKFSLCLNATPFGPFA